MALTDKLTAVADAIRGKTGGTEGLTLDQMAMEIEGISGGGGENAKLIAHLELTEDVTPGITAWTAFADGEELGELKKIIISGKICGASTSTAEGAANLWVNSSKFHATLGYVGQKQTNTRWLLLDTVFGEEFAVVRCAVSNIVPPRTNTNLTFNANVPVYFKRQNITSIGLTFVQAMATGFGAGTDLYIWGVK